MAIITVDFETYYSKEYSLSKMSTVDYILDPRFQTIMAAIKVNDGPSEAFIGHDAVAERLAQFDWTKCAFLAHHAHFDGAILAWRYGIYPALYLDTLGMARAITHAVLGRSSLEKVSEYLGLPPKGHEVHNALGLRLEAMSQQFMEGYVAYCLRDNDNCKMIFDRLRKVVPASELALIDTVVRMFTTPQVRLNPTVLAEHLNHVRAEAAACMARVAHIDKAVFSSNQQFAALLEQHGVEVPTKISPATGQVMPALAKNDRGFKELCQDEEQPLEVQAVLAARISSKSTLEETRTQRMLDRALREWHAPGEGLGPVGSLISYGTGWAPVPLKYWGAHTGRLSGDGGENWQNFKRGSRIREAIEAPPGYRVVHRDASQIEARMVAWLARCMTLLEAFAQGRDVYSEFASIVYGETVTKADKPRRFVGKTGILGLGYQTGAEKLRHTLFIGNGGISVKVTLEEAKKIVNTYRYKAYPEIPGLWSAGDNLLDDIADMSVPYAGGKRPTHAARRSVLPFPVVEAGHDCIWLPNGTCIAYPNLRYQGGRNANGQVTLELGYNSPYGEFKHMYGGKVTENVSQALSRIIVTDSAERVKKLTGYHPFLSTHDSLDYCVPESEAQWFDQELERQFAIRPWWAPDLPLASEGGFGRNLLIAESENHPEHNT